MESFLTICYTGTSKVADTYKVGKRTTDVMLEILNLSKTEVISIDIISNQEFTEVIELIFNIFPTFFLVLTVYNFCYPL